MKQDGWTLRRRIRRIAFAAVTLSTTFSLPAVAQQIQIQMDPAKTVIEWTLGDVLHTVQGTFRLKSGTVLFDPHTGSASGQVIVDASSGNSGNRTRDSKMHREVLESARYPEIIFSPTHVSGFIAGQETSTVQVSGDFTIHGDSHPITLTVPVSVKTSTVEGRTTFEVPYDAWGMKNPSTFLLKVDKTVKISISAVGTMQDSTDQRAAH